MARAVIFHPHGARIVEGVNPDDYKEVPNCLIDPEIPKGIPPHHWKRQGDKIVAMTELEKELMEKRMHHSSPNQIEIKSLEFKDHHYLEMAQVASQAAREVVYSLSLKIITVAVIAGALSAVIARYF